jgi:SAM-dependent methyltransferase
MRLSKSIYSNFCDMANAQGGSILEVGSRVVSPGSKSKRIDFPQCTYTGFDIYPDENTDVCGDAHQLSNYFTNSFDAVFSVSVLEHLAAPWLFAAEVNRVLCPGGLTMHATHPAWPPHELPWDFYRFSDYGLEAVFSPLMGFETVEIGLYSEIRMRFVDETENAVHPQPLDAFPAWAGVAIISRKVAEAPHWLQPPDDIDMIYPKLTRYPQK